MAGLPPGWEWDYDGQRWFYTYKPNGHIQYHFPKEGDEFPDFVDFSGPAPVLAPEELLASQQQVKRQTSKGNTDGAALKTRLSATSNRPVSNVWEEDMGATVFQPESFMYLGPGAYNDVSPLADEEDEAARKVVAGSIAEVTTGSSSKVLSPAESEKTTPAIKKSEVSPPTASDAVIVDGGAVIDAGPVINAGPVADAQVAEIDSGIVIDSGAMIDAGQAETAVPMLDSREVPHELPVEVFNPVGVIAEMASEHTARAIVESNPPPVEIADNSVLAPIETALPEGYSELPEKTSPVDRNKPKEFGPVTIEIPQARGLGVERAPVQQPIQTPVQQPVQPPLQQPIEPLVQQPIHPPVQQQVQAPPVENRQNGTAAEAKYQPFLPGQATTQTTEQMENRRLSLGGDPRRLSLQREQSLMGISSNNSPKIDLSMLPAALSVHRQSISPERPQQPPASNVAAPPSFVPDVGGGLQAAPSVLKPARNSQNYVSPENSAPGSPVTGGLQAPPADPGRPPVSPVPSILRPARGRAPSLPGQLPPNIPPNVASNMGPFNVGRNSYIQPNQGAPGRPEERKYMPYTGITGGYRMSYGGPLAPAQGPGQQFPPRHPQQPHHPPPGPPGPGQGFVQHPAGFQQQGPIPPHMANPGRPQSTPPPAPPPGQYPIQQYPGPGSHIPPSQQPYIQGPNGQMTVPPNHLQTTGPVQAGNFGPGGTPPVQPGSNPQFPPQPSSSGSSPTQHMRRASSSVSMVQSLDSVGTFTPSPDSGPSPQGQNPVSVPQRRLSGLRNSISSPSQNGGPPIPDKTPAGPGSYFPPQPTPREHHQPQPQSKRMSMPPAQAMDWMRGESTSSPPGPSPPVPAKIPEHSQGGLHRSQSVGSSRNEPLQQHQDQSRPMQPQAGFVLGSIEEHHEPPSAGGFAGGLGPQRLMKSHTMTDIGAPVNSSTPPPMMPTLQHGPPPMQQQPPYPMDQPGDPGVPPQGQQAPTTVPYAQLPPLGQMTPLGRIVPQREESMRRQAQENQGPPQKQGSVRRHGSVRRQSSLREQTSAPTSGSSTPGQAHGQFQGPVSPPSNAGTPLSQKQPRTPQQVPVGQAPQVHVSPLNAGSRENMKGPVPAQLPSHLGQVPPGHVAPNSFISQQQTPQGPMPEANPSQARPGPPGYMPQGQIPPAQILPGQFPPGQMPPGQFPPGQAPPGQIPPGQIPPGQIPPGQIPPGQIPQGQISQGQIPQGQIPQGQVSQTSRPQRKLSKVRPGPQSNVQGLPPSQLPPGQIPPGQIPIGQMPPGQNPQAQMPQRTPSQARPGPAQSNGQVARVPQTQAAHPGSGPQLPPPGQVNPQGPHPQSQPILPPGQHIAPGQPGQQALPPNMLPQQLAASKGAPPPQGYFPPPGNQMAGYSHLPQNWNPPIQAPGPRPGSVSPRPLGSPVKEKERKWTKWFKSSKSPSQIRNSVIQHIPNAPTQAPQAGLQSPPLISSQVPGLQPAMPSPAMQQFSPAQPTTAPLLPPVASPSTNIAIQGEARAQQSTEIQSPQRSPSLAPQPSTPGRHSPSPVHVHPGTPLGSHPPNGPGYRSPRLIAHDGSPESSFAGLPSQQRLEPAPVMEQHVAPIPPTQPKVAPIPPTQPKVAPIPLTQPKVAPIPPTQPKVAPIPPTQPKVAPIPPTQPKVAPIPPTQPMVAPIPPTQPKVAPIPPNQPKVAPIAPIDENAMPTLPVKEDAAPVPPLTKPVYPIPQPKATEPLQKAQPVVHSTEVNPKPEEKKDNKWSKTSTVDYTGDDWGDDDEWG